MSKCKLCRFACAIALAVPTLLLAENGAYSGSGGSFLAPTTTGQAITVTGVPLSGTTAALTFSCPITFFGAGTYQWNWQCAGGKISAASTDSSLSLSGNFVSGSMTLSGSGGGRGGIVRYWYEFSGTFIGSIKLNGVSQAILGSVSAAVETSAVLGTSTAPVTGLSLGWNSEYSPVLVASGGNARLLAADNLLGMNPSSYGTWGSGTGQFESIAGLAHDASGRIYISDSTLDRLVRIDNLTGSNWVEMGSFGTGALHFSSPGGVAIDASGKVWVADAGNNRIVRFDDMSGTNWTSFGAAGAGVNQFSSPSAVALDALGRIYVADSGNGRLVRIDDLSGTNWITLSTINSGVYAYNLSGINGVAVAPGGQIAVSTASGWMMRFGDMTGANAQIGYWSPSIAGISADPAGEIFVVGGFVPGLAETLGLTGTGVYAGTMAQTTLQASAVLALAKSVTAPAAPTISTTKLAFGNQNVGEPSIGKIMTLKNIGGTPMPISSIVADADYVVTDTCPASLSGGSSCKITVEFDPTTTGSRPATLSISTTSVHPLFKVALTGTGTAPNAVIVPGTLQFQPQLINTASAPETLLLSNTGNGPLTISSITATGDYSVSNNCPTVIAPQNGCTLQVAFTPVASGLRAGTLSISDDNVPTGATQMVTLSGTGSATSPTLTVTPGSLLFPNQQVGVASAAQTITVKNAATSAVTLSAPVFPSGFTGTNQCGTTLAAGASCSVLVQFVPAAAGPASGSVLIPVTGRASLAVEASGTGVTSATPVLKASPSPLNFAGYVVGDNPSLNLTVSNSTGIPVGIRSRTLSGSSVFSVTGSNCPAILAGGASCTVNITFIPTAVATYSASYTMIESSGAKTVVSITGTATLGD
ncbi:MAG TPA: choice-of-anchor D domain-containing protein [Terracidiphilus sp.]|jgi:hypothetical protein|nr:choice-of-anchor D domain-containing protein [Terracidiphilus sp.]